MQSSTLISGNAGKDDDLDDDEDDEDDADLTIYSADAPTKPEVAQPSPSRKRKARASKYEVDAPMNQFLHADRLPTGHPARGCRHKVWDRAYKNDKLRE